MAACETLRLMANGGPLRRLNASTFFYLQLPAAPARARTHSRRWPRAMLRFMAEEVGVPRDLLARMPEAAPQVYT